MMDAAVGENENDRDEEAEIVNMACGFRGKGSLGVKNKILPLYVGAARR
jgi:hypothetical protein